MVMRINALEQPQAGSSAEKRAAYVNTISRYVTVKEQHAELTKKEVDILWHDYFKPEHLEKYPDLHTSVWETTKLASTNKQAVDLDAAKRLVDSVDKIAETFWATKGVTYDDAVAQVRFGK
jgi:nickel superoxide dismutase